MKNINICKECYYYKALRWNLLKKDIAHPRVYFIHCGLATEEKTDCEYFYKKKLKHRLGMDK
jgi:hypothetical protein